MIDIYLITNKVTNKKYVGQTRSGYKRRWQKHCCKTHLVLHTLLSKAITEYGKGNFIVSLLKQVPDIEGDFWEEYYIKHLHTHYSEGGYNMTLGGKQNPMNDFKVKEKHLRVCRGEQFREKQRKANSELLVRNSEKQSIRIRATSKDGTELKFNSLREACRLLRLSNRKAISNCCRKNLNNKENPHYYKDFKWEFI